MNKHPSEKTNIEENSYDWFRYGSFWSLQKEHAVGREIGEKGTLNLVFAFS